MHNLRFIIRLTEEARAAIIDGTFAEYKETFLTQLLSPTLSGVNHSLLFFCRKSCNMANSALASVCSLFLWYSFISLYSPDITDDTKQPRRKHARLIAEDVTANAGLALKGLGMRDTIWLVAQFPGIAEPGAQPLYGLFDLIGADEPQAVLHSG